MIEVFVFVFGSMIGSFLNVCIHRMPLGESIVFPPSHCPQCKAHVKWRDNIPLFSYVWLKGRCRDCDHKISPRYFISELIVALIWLGVWLYFGQSIHFIAAGIYLSILYAVSVTDFETGLIPDKLSLSGILIALGLSAFFPELQKQTVWYFGLLQSLIGVLVGGGALLGTALLGNVIFKKDSMGGGDIKLNAMIGAFIGWRGGLFAFLLAPIFALPFGLFMKFIKKEETIVFGPFIALSGVVYLFFEVQILSYFFYF